MKELLAQILATTMITQTSVGLPTTPVDKTILNNKSIAEEYCLKHLREINYLEVNLTLLRGSTFIGTIDVYAYFGEKGITPYSWQLNTAVGGFSTTSYCNANSDRTILDAVSVPVNEKLMQEVTRIVLTNVRFGDFSKGNSYYATEIFFSTFTTIKDLEDFIEHLKNVIESGLITVINTEKSKSCDVDDVNNNSKTNKKEVIYDPKEKKSDLLKKKKSLLEQKRTQLLLQKEQQEKKKAQYACWSAKSMERNSKRK